MKVLHNQIIAHNTANDAWKYGLGLIESSGNKVITEDNKLTKEIQNLVLPVLYPNRGWPIPGSNWYLPGLENYAHQLLSGENPGFDYTYGERIRRGLTPIDSDRLAREALLTKMLGQEHFRDHYGIDQLELVINSLLENPTTRRAIMYIWEPSWDLGSYKHVPCLQVVEFLYREDAVYHLEDRLHLTAFFRSHDIQQAWPVNVFGLNKLLEHVANRTSMKPGMITTVSASAHKYEL